MSRIMNSLGRPVVLILILIALALLGSCADDAEQALFTPGSYRGSAEGLYGPISVVVQVDANDVLDIEVVETSETPTIGGAVFKDLAQIVTRQGSVDGVEAVSGATRSSEGFLAAVAQALATASTGAVRQATSDDASVEPLFDASYDVIVVGSGGAGLSAAYTARDAGASVVVLEKMPIVGGNTNYATGGMNAAGTVQQERNDIEDSAELYFEDTMTGGRNINNPGLVRILARNAADSVAWLVSLGANLEDVGRLGGASANRAHRPSGGGKVGPEIVATLTEATTNLAGIPLFTNMRVIEILVTDGEVQGVRVEDRSGTQHTVSGTTVVMASGGFGANNDLVAEYDPSLRGFGTTNHAGATGDGIALLENVDAMFVDMTEIQTHPTVVPAGQMITEAVRGNGAIMVARSGARFVDELGTRDVVSQAILSQEGGTAYLLFDQDVRDSLRAIESYVSAGLVTEAESLDALADALAMPTETVNAAVTEYNAFVAAGTDAEYGRTSMARPIQTGPFYAIEVAPAVHHTMGGVMINEEAEVISVSEMPIPGLYAAGEVTGGVHGGNRLGGNALADIVTFGRIAGRNAAQFAAQTASR